MAERHIKYLFYLLAAGLLVFMLVSSRQAGISCDEVLHYNHSADVYDYFATHGADTSALHTPVTNLRHYGQSFDNIITILARWSGIEDIYGFRHIMSSIAGWVVVVITALFAIWLGTYRHGITVILLFAISPTFIGHSWNNLKDVPFALGYISSMFFMLRFIFRRKRADIILLTLSMAFILSIRAGGLLVFCYLLLFTSASFIRNYINGRSILIKDLAMKFMLIAGMVTVAWFLSIMLWPYALQAPVANVIKSYHVMAHFPDTFRQIFEGKVEWSDFMPWYYLPKSMLITIPFTVLSGLLLFVFFFRRIISGEKGLQFIFIVFAILFPIVFVVYEKSNLYSSWRQFLFLYPPLVLLAAEGIVRLVSLVKTRGYGAVLMLGFILLSIHPLKYMSANLPYSYIYYNQFAGGTGGAFAKYELDYYYVSQTRASEWLTDYLVKKGTVENIKVKATYSVAWQFREYPGIQTSYFRWEERSMHDWDYAIVVNRYIPPFQLENEIWPPADAIHTEYADGVPVCAVVARKTREDLLGYIALKNDMVEESVRHFEMALKETDTDEMIFYNFAAALVKSGQYVRADSALKAGLALNPGFDPILMYLGNIAKTGKRYEEAALWYRRLIKENRKYFEAYVALAEVLADKDAGKARQILMECLRINPAYKPAILSLAGTYRESHPDIAAKYEELAKRIK